MRNTQKIYDVIVVGVGSMGSSTLYHLAKSGASVLGIEQFHISHREGSHTGQTRIVRKAYFEHPDYVPLLESAYQGWHDIESEAGYQLLHQIGFLYMGKSQHPKLEAVRASAKQYNIPITELGKGNNRNYPQFNVPDGYESVFEPGAGFVTTDKTILTYTERAIKHGASILQNTKVNQWQVKNGNVEVQTSQGSFTCKHLVLTSGAYSNDLLPKSNFELTPTRQLIIWAKPKKWDLFELGTLPCWTIAPDDEKGIYYGFPILPQDRFPGSLGLKMAHHYPGEEMDDFSVQTNDESERKKMWDFAQEFLPDAMDEILSTSSCLYTYSKDDNFYIDKLPDHAEHVTVAAGFSGHGFKFVPVVGKILAELALTGKTAHPISFLSFNRKH